MSTESEHVRAHIELAIERARDGVSERIDEIESRLRDKLDFGQLAGEHAPQLLAAGAVLGFLVGFGVPKVITRSLQLGIPLLLALKVAKSRKESTGTE